MSIRASSLSRPSIREIAASILNPQKSCRHHLHATRSSPKPSPVQFANYKRSFHNQSVLFNASSPPRSRDRGPPSSETTQTEFSNLDILGGTPAPSTAIDACLWDGFHLNSGVKIGDGAGVLLVAGEAFTWRPWEATRSSKPDSQTTSASESAQGKARLLNNKGQWEVPDSAFALLELVHPKPDLLILGLGPKMAPLSPATRTAIARLGIRVEVQDTRNACAQFNLLATERGVGNVAAGLVPVGWREGRGIVSGRA